MAKLKPNAAGSIDPATNPVIQAFLDDFARDPVIRLDLEMFFAHAVRVNPCIPASDLAKLAWFSETYRNPKYQSIRELVENGAKQAVLGILQAYHEIKEQL
ncbi:MAG: hypothetical protein ACRD72_07440 [Candidatus Angelobacter sp.]